MRNADGSCPTRVAVWYGGMRMVPPHPRCGKVPGCTSLDSACCDFSLVRDTQGDAKRFPPAVLREVRGYCEEELADARLLSRLAAQGGLRRVYVGADGQRPDLERQLDAALRARGLRVLNESRPPPPRVWSSQYTRTGWRLADVEGALADMFLLAEAEVFVANPASSFSGCVRDIRAARGRLLASTQVGIPPHDARAWRAGLAARSSRRPSGRVS
jgi:hypothetical protein